MRGHDRLSGPQKNNRICAKHSDCSICHGQAKLNGAGCGLLLHVFSFASYSHCKNSPRLITLPSGGADSPLNRDCRLSHADRRRSTIDLRDNSHSLSGMRAVGNLRKGSRAYVTRVWEDDGRKSPAAGWHIEQPTHRLEWVAVYAPE